MTESNKYKKIPKVDTLLSNFSSEYNKKVLKYCINNVLEKYRLAIKTEELKNIEYNNILHDIEKEYTSLQTGSLKNVINATGVILHTNLGRAPLYEKDLDEIKKIVCGYSNLEYDLITGVRGNRYSHISEYLKIITGSEDCLIVNNNASAVFLILNTFSKGRYVLISRSELVEIGDSFRIPEVIKGSGALIKEVGTTNKTRQNDYIEAINEETAILLKVHKSNYYIGGFFEEVNGKDIVKIASKYKLMSYYDVGSGVLDKTIAKKLKEPSVVNIIRDGFDLVSFSGDKLLGGPQAGIILGKKLFIDTLKKNQLLRMLRVDKLTLALLQTTLKHYIDDDLHSIATASMLMAEQSTLNKKANTLKNLIFQNFEKKLNICEVKKDIAYTGGGSSPDSGLPTWTVFIKFKKYKSMDIKNKLMVYNVPVICRLNQEGLIFDILTIEEKSFDLIIKALEWAITI
jgi:L-seryl-tRNA(Ser) seleniumtransferase